MNEYGQGFVDFDISMVRNFDVCKWWRPSNQNIGAWFEFKQKKLQYQVRQDYKMKKI